MLSTQPSHLEHQAHDRLVRWTNHFRKVWDVEDPNVLCAVPCSTLYRAPCGNCSKRARRKLKYHLVCSLVGFWCSGVDVSVLRS